MNKKLLGFDCFGCGIQRALALILDGEFSSAFYMYPAIYTLLLLFGLVAINAFKNFRFGTKIITILAIINGILMVTSFVIKNFTTH